MARRKRRPRERSSTQRSGRSATATRYEVSVSIRALPRVLLLVTITLLLCHGALALYHYQVEKLPWLVRQLFDVDQENNLPTWFSSVLLLVTSALLWFCARQKRTDEDSWAGHWYVLAVGFLLMSLDEVAGIHESINSAIVMTWAIPGGIAGAVIGIAFIPFRLHLPGRTAVLVAVAGTAFLAGAAGLEIIGNDLVGQRLRDTLRYNMWTLFEESLEMLGVILFIHALLRYMGGPGARSVDAALEVGQ